MLLVAFGFTKAHGGVPDINYLTYIENKGQWNEKVLYKARLRGGAVFLENTAFTFLFYENNLPGRIHDWHNGKKTNDSLQPVNFHAIKLQLEGALQTHPVLKQETQKFYYNYYIGSDPKKWASQVPVCKSVFYKNIYTGIDVKIFGQGNNMRYDFIVSPGADPSKIQLKFTGQDKLFLRDSKLVMTTSVGEVEQEVPYAYQKNKSGIKKQVACHYILSGNTVGIEITGAYDKSSPLVIDPTLVFSTYTGSTSDNWGMSATYDINGNGYTAGVCFDTGYPTTPGAFQTSPIAGGNGMNATDISISKFNPTGNQLLFSTYLGGSLQEGAHSITVDHDDNLVVFGRSFSSDFPVKAGCYDVSYNNSCDIILTRFNATGTALLGSTFIGGSGLDGQNNIPLNRNYGDIARGAVHVDENNDIYVASCTSSNNFPITGGCFQNAKKGAQDACVFKMNSGLTTLLFSTYLGGSANDAAYNFSFDSQNRMYITGGTDSNDFPTTSGALHTSALGSIDGFVAHLSLAGNALLQSSYIGTPNYDQSYFVQVDKRDNVYLYGQSSHGGYPITPGVYSNANSGQFIHKLDPTLSTTFFSTQFGTGHGETDISPSAFLVDNCENIYVSGWGGETLIGGSSGSSIAGMPLTPNAFQASTDGSDFYFGVFTKNMLAIHYGTFFGGGSSHEHVDGGTSCYDKAGVIYQAICAGCGGNSDTPTTPGAWSNINASPNCNNALVKFQMDLRPTVAEITLRPFIKTGCPPFTANFLNTSINAQNYAWDFGDGVTSTAVSPPHTFTNVGTYTVVLIASGQLSCNQADTTKMVLTVKAPLSIPALSSHDICKKDTVQLVASLPSATDFLWAPALSLNNSTVYNPLSWPAANTVYSLTVKDTVCHSTASATLLVNVHENTTLIKSNQGGVCANDTVRLSTSGTFTNYLWSNGKGTAFIDISVPGIYSLTTVDNYGCKGIDTIKIAGLAIVQVGTHSVTLCEGQQTQFFTTTGNYKYKWLPASFLSADTIFNPIASPQSSMIYTVSVSNEACKNSGTFKVVVNPLPQLSVSQSTISLIYGETAVLDVITDITCYWSPSDWLSCDSCKTTIAQPENNTVYFCHITNSFGCIATNSVLVELAPTFYVPNIFTPNDDGINDVFRPVFTGYVKLQVNIFDRWGAEVYSYNTLDGGWDGGYRHSKAKTDVYVYKIDATDYRNKRLEMTGFVTLLR